MRKNDLDLTELFDAIDEKKAGGIWNDYVPISVEGKTTNVYLTSGIEEPSEYNKLIHLLKTAKKSQTFVLHINNGGGMLDSAVAIIDAIKTSKATVKANLSGTVASAATMITLACKDVYVAPHISWLTHAYSAGNHGKGQELKARQSFMDKQTETLMYEVYKDFHTKEEIQSVIDGKDYWLSSDEVKERLAKRK